MDIHFLVRFILLNKILGCCYFENTLVILFSFNIEFLDWISSRDDRAIFDYLRRCSVLIEEIGRFFHLLLYVRMRKL